MKGTERAGLRPTLFFSKFISLALILVFGSVAPASSELDDSCNVCWKSPLETADEMRRGAERDLIGVPASPLLLPGTALPPQVPVGIADGRSHGRWNRHGARNRSEMVIWKQRNRQLDHEMNGRDWLNQKRSRL